MWACLYVIRGLTFLRYRVLLDDVDASGRKGGRIYETYGVDAEGAVVIVRPDGFVGATMSLKDGIKLSAYFAAFMES